MTIVAILLAVMVGLAALVVAILFLVGALSVLWIGTRVIFAWALDWGPFSERPRDAVADCGIEIGHTADLILIKLDK